MFWNVLRQNQKIFFFFLIPFLHLGRFKNVALGKPATASSKVGDIAHLTDGRVDTGNFENHWSSDPTVAWIKIDLGAETQIYSVCSHFTADQKESFVILS